jgi:penicillin amidase
VRWLVQAEDPEVATLRDAMAAWDYRYTVDSSAPTLFETMMSVWQERVARERFANGHARLVELVHAAGGVAAQLIEQGDDHLRWFGDDMRGQVVAAAREALAQVRTRYGDNPTSWEWGKVHQAHWRHPLSTPGRELLDVGPAPVDGGPDTLRNTGAGQPPFAAASGAEYRLIVDFAEPDRFLAVQSQGNSGQPGSPHYADQFQDWLSGTYHVVSLRRPEVEQDAEGRTILQPHTPGGSHANVRRPVQVDGSGHP